MHNEPPASQRKNPLRGVLAIVAEVLLILATVALLVAMWLPALIGPTEEKRQRDVRSWLRQLR